MHKRIDRQRGTLSPELALSSSNLCVGSKELVPESQKLLVQSALLLQARWDLMLAQQNVATQEALIKDNIVVKPTKKQNCGEIKRL